MVNLFQIFAALRQGATLTKSGAWSHTAAATSALSGIIIAALQVAQGLGYALPFTPDQINAISAGVVACVGLFSGFVHVATNVDAGLPPKRGPVEPVDTIGPGGP